MRVTLLFDCEILKRKASILYDFKVVYMLRCCGSFTNVKTNTESQQVSELGVVELEEDIRCELEGFETVERNSCFIFLSELDECYVPCVDESYLSGEVRLCEHDFLPLLRNWSYLKPGYCPKRVLRISVVTNVGKSSSIRTLFGKFLVFARGMLS